MYVCMHVSVYVCMCHAACRDIHIHTWIQRYMHACICDLQWIPTRVRVSSPRNIRLHISLHVYMNNYVTLMSALYLRERYVYMCTCMNTYVTLMSALYI